MFKKKDTVKVTAYAPSTGLIDLFPIEHRKFPKYFKSFQKAENFRSIKTCPGFVDLYSNSLSIPAWQDIKITISSTGNIEVMAPQVEYSAVSHPLEEQAPGVWPGYVSVKLESPWLIKCNKDVPWYMIQPTWEQNNPDNFSVIPGSLEFKYYNETNINLLFPIPETTKTYTIRAGETIAMLLPGFTEEYSVECKYISEQETDKLLKSIWVFKPGNAYSRFRSFLRNKQ